MVEKGRYVRYEWAHVVENAISDTGVLFCYEKMKEMDSIVLQEIRYDEELLSSFGKQLLEQALRRDPAREEEVEEMIRKKREEEGKEEKIEEIQEPKLNDISYEVEEVKNDKQEEEEEEEEIQSTKRSCCAIM